MSETYLATAQTSGSLRLLLLLCADSTHLNHFHDSGTGQITGSQRKRSKHWLQRQAGAGARCGAAIAHPRLWSVSLSSGAPLALHPRRPLALHHKVSQTECLLLLAPTRLSSSRYTPTALLSLHCLKEAAAQLGSHGAAGNAKHLSVWYTTWLLSIHPH